MAVFQPQLKLQVKAVDFSQIQKLTTKSGVEMRIVYLAMMAAIAFACSGLFAGEQQLFKYEDVRKLQDYKSTPNDFRIYAVGDSITRHPVRKELKWDHLAGMAASSEEKDYVHLVAAQVAQILPDKKVKIFISNQGNDAVNSMKGIDDAKAYQPDLVIVQLGEHVESKAFGSKKDEPPEKIEADYCALLDAFKSISPSPMIICTGTWNPIPGAKAYSGRNAEIDRIQSECCRQKVIPFVSVEKYALDPSCSGTGESGGVKWHPNDAGQAGYAKGIIDALEPRLKVWKRSAAIDETPKIGDIAFEKIFNKDLSGWKPAGKTEWVKIVPDDNCGSCVEISAEGQGELGVVGGRDVLGRLEKAKAQAYLLTPGVAKKLAKLKGYELEVEVGVKGDSIPIPAKPWDGVRIAVNYATSTGPYNDCYYNMLSGSFPWRNVSWRIRIPEDMKNMSLSLGLIAASGKVRFDHLKMTVTDVPFSTKTPPSGEAFKGYSVQRLRGFVTSIREPGNENGRKMLRSISTGWNINVAKLWFSGNKAIFEEKDNASLRKWMDSV